MTPQTETEHTESIEAVIAHQPTIALLDPQKKEELYSFLEREIAAFVPDLSTETSRKKIASLAYKVSRTKSAIDEAGAELKAEWLKKSRAIDESRKEIREKLDTLRDKARQPLTDWEAAEDRRVRFVEGAFTMTLRDLCVVKAEDTSETVAHLLRLTEDYEIREDVFQDRYSAAMDARRAAVLSLTASLARIQRQEAERVELARLRAESEARAKADREAAEKAELARLQQDREERERQRLVELEEARQAGIARAKEIEEQMKVRQAAEVAQAKQEAEDRVKRELQAAHQAELAKERELREAAEQKERDERLRMEREERVRQEAQKKAALIAEQKAAADRKLELNKKHRKEVMQSVAECICREAPTVSAEASLAIVNAIVKGVIPGVTISFL